MMPSEPHRNESSSRTFRLAMKELREILRDRRTVLTLVLMPLLVYPLLGVVMRKGVLANMSLTPQSSEVQVCFETPEELAMFEYEMAGGQTILVNFGEREESTPPAPDSILTQSADQAVTFKVYVLQNGATIHDMLTGGHVDLGIRIATHESPAEAIEHPRPFQEWSVYQREGAVLAARGVKEISLRMDAINENYNRQLLRRHELELRKPQTIVSEVLSSTGGDEGVPVLITFIPLMLVLMTMTGAVYPAIDLTAGERERGTMEILVAAPVSRMTLLAGKFLAVLVVALLTATMNLISMFATLFALGLEGTVLGNLGPTVIVQVIVLMVMFAAFFSAVLLSITSVARSFKEAQAYLVPLMLVSLAPGIFCLMPDIEMNGLLAVTPLVNTVLMARDLLVGDVNLLMFAIVLISTALYGMLALSLAARIFGSDAVLYGSGGSWSDLIRRPENTVHVASMAVSMSTLAAVFSLFIVAGAIPSRLDTTLTNQLLASAVVSVFLFVVVPLVAAKIGKVRVSSGFALCIPRWLSWLAALLLGASLWPFVYEIEISILSEQRIEEIKQLYESFDLNLKAVPLWVKLLSLAVAPAACEEFFFRGFLQNSIRSKTSSAMAVLSAGILFGLFHVIVKDALLFERLIPSTLMGIVLGVVFERSGSVLPGMLLHVIHNGFLVIVAEYEDKLTESGIGISDHQHLPTQWLLMAAVPVTVAFIILWHLKSVRSRSVV